MVRLSVNMGKNRKEWFGLAFLYFSVSYLSPASIQQNNFTSEVINIPEKNIFCSLRDHSALTVNDTPKSAPKSSPHFCGEHRQSASRFSESTLRSFLWTWDTNLDSCFSPIRQFANTISVFLICHGAASRSPTSFFLYISRMRANRAAWVAIQVIHP